MIKRLRVKLILTNMLLVTLVLLIVFATLLISSAQRLSSTSRQALSHALMSPERQLPKPAIGAGPRSSPMEPPNGFAIFTVELDADGRILSSDREAVDISDETLAQAVAYVRNADRPDGVIPSLSLRYLTRETGSGLRIAFADRSSESAPLRSLLLISLAVGAGGLVAFLFVSILLSGIALRPVARAWEQQSRFVADASHELKTPLTVILANLGILQTHADETIRSQQKWLTNTREEANRMKQLVDDLLFLAKADHTQNALVLNEVNFSEIVLCRLLPFESVAFERGVTISSEITPDLRVLGNAGQLGQLAAILFDNACKYVDANGRISVTLTQEQNTACLRVTNTGTLIAADDLPHLFERFYRADKSRVRASGGYGLGLSIASSIVNTHHGRIAAASDADAGTTFTVCLKLKT